MSQISGFGPDGPIYGRPVTLAASAARTATGNGTPVPAHDFDTLRLTLAVTAASGGTPSLTVNVQTSEDGSSGWTTVDSFGAKTGVSTERLIVGLLDNYVRASWTISGTTPSFTFSVAGQAP